MEPTIFYEKNLAAIKVKYPELYKKITGSFDHTETVDIRIYRNLAGLPLVLMEDKMTGKIVCLHNEQDPEKEASMIVDSINIGPGDVRFIIGMGLGYVPLEIVRRSLPHLKLILIEPSFDLFLEAIKNVDLTEILNNEEVAVIIGDIGDIKPVISQMGAHISLLLKGAQITYFESEREFFPEFFTKTAKTVQEQVGHFLCGVHTADKIGPVFFENSLWNFTTVLNSANLSALAGVLKDKTVLVVGAGPSLHENLPLIKKYRNKFAIITVDTALPVLIKNNIIPDLAATVDYHHISFEKYRDVIEKTSEIPIVFAAQCASMTIKPYRCPVKFFISQPFGIYRDLSSHWKYWAYCANMQAVSHLALTAANVTKAERIILAGFDLSYVGLKSYSEGTSLTFNIDIESLVWVKDQNGDPLPTSIQMVGQKALMEYHISLGSAEFFNIGTGVKIEGARKIEFEPFISTLPDIGMDVSETIRASWENAPKPSTEVVMDYLDQAEKDLNKYIRLCDKGKDCARTAKKNLKKSNDNNYRACMSYVEGAISIYEKIMSNSSAVEMATGLFEGKETRLRMDEVHLGMDQEKTTNRNKIISEMDLLSTAVESRKKAALRLLKDYNRLHGRLFREKNLIEEIKRKGHGRPKAESYSKIGNVYLDYMDFVQAEDAFRSAIIEDESLGDAWLGLGKTLGQLRRHKESIDCLEIALSLSPRSDVFKKAFDYEKKYPERALSEANSYIGGQATANWASRIACEVLSFYPENKVAADIADRAKSFVSATKERQEKILPYLMAGPEKAIDMIDEIAEDDLDFATRVIELLRKQHPGNASVIEYLGLIYLSKNDIKTAKRFFAQARSLAPDSYSPRVHLARVLVSEGSLGEALMYLEQAQMLAPPEIAESFSESIADILFELGRHTEALSHYKKGALSFPENAGIIKKMGDVYAAMGIMDAARHAWKASGFKDQSDE